MNQTGGDLTEQQRRSNAEDDPLDIDSKESQFHISGAKCLDKLAFVAQTKS